MAAVNPLGDEKYWMNGEPFEGIRYQISQTGDQKYWFNGAPEQNLFPVSNSDTGKFLLLFE